ncbi:Thioredoxin related protein [Moritella sp. PE36]|uniref:GNAT family N-acetyltransferase n=1 Tax=Moritella sp. PE36 TaxID=58051 RepID=UPI00015689FB|nr:Thioredoxin related protein [Moritella sp. PE36]
MHIMEIKSYSNEWDAEITDLFYQSVHAIDPTVYTPEQKEAWAPTPPDYATWSKRLKVKRPLVAIIDGQVAGFIELDADGHIDCTYTHPSFQGMGVASALYEHLLAEARIRDIQRLYVEASLIAKPFFEHRGFTTVKQNTLQRNGVTLVNFTMEFDMTTSYPDFNPDYREDAPTITDVEAWAGYAILEFGASWCGHCQAAEPVVKAVLVEYPALPLIKIVDGKGKILGRRFRVKLWPTLILLKDGLEVTRLVRPLVTDDVKSFLKVMHEN